MDVEGFVILELHDQTLRGWNHDRERLIKLVDSRQPIFLLGDDKNGKLITKYRNFTDEVVSTQTLILSATPSPCQTQEELREQRETATRAAAELEEALRDLFPIDPSGRPLVSVGEISLTLESSGTWAATRSGRLVERFDDAESALIEFEASAQRSDGTIVWHSDQDEILELLSNKGFDTFLVDHRDGLVSLEGWWIPADLHPFYGGTTRNFRCGR